MTALIVLLVLLACAVGFRLLQKNTEAPEPPSLDPEQQRRAALELHRIHRRLQVADLEHQQRRDMNRLRRQIRKTLDDGR